MANYYFNNKRILLLFITVVSFPYYGYTQFVNSVSINQSFALSDRHVNKNSLTRLEQEYMNEYKNVYRTYCSEILAGIKLSKKSSLNIGGSINYSGFRTKIIPLPDTVQSWVGEATGSIHGYEYNYFALLVNYQRTIIIKPKYIFKIGIGGGLNKKRKHIQYYWTYSLHDQRQGGERKDYLKTEVNRPIKNSNIYTLSTNIEAAFEKNLSKKISLNLSVFYTQFWNKFWTAGQFNNDLSASYMHLTNPTAGLLYQYGIKLGVNYNLNKR